MGKLFGTDGIRGIACKYPLDPNTVNIIATAASIVLRTKDVFKHPVIIGRDTRESGQDIVSHLKNGLGNHGIDVWDLGVVTTPCVAYLVKKYPAVAGIVVSASHNPYEYNGIKFFSHKGIKLSDAVEEKIEEKIHELSEDMGFRYKKTDKIQPEQRTSLAKEYAGFLLRSVPKSDGFKRFKVVLDCANGASYKIAPQVFSALGVEYVLLNDKPNGKNINKDCGSLYPDGLSRQVLKHKADCGIAFDGDSDRVMFVDETGIVRDGDYLLTILAKFLKQKRKLKKNTLVTTVMANLGLFKAMKKNGVKVCQTAVGDRYVHEEMLKTGAIIGGEQSGHIILSQYLPTGDGILSALQVLNVMRETSKPLSELSQIMQKYPQVLLNEKVNNKIPVKSLPKTLSAIKNAEKKLKSDGRVLVRYSGTENLLRVMIEGLDKDIITGMAKDIINTAVKEIAAISA